MKTFHVFIASSLKFQKERDLIEKIYTERNCNELNVVVHRHEINGNNDIAPGDSQKIIDSEIAKCDVIVFFAGNWIHSKTIHEFEVAVKNASNKHIYFYQNPNLDYIGDNWENASTWQDFYSTYMAETLKDNTIIERYEKSCITLDQLRDTVVKDREFFFMSPFLLFQVIRLNMIKSFQKASQIVEEEI